MEYDNPDTALTAIQNLGNVEVDGRRLRVGFSNNSGLEAIAKQRGLTITPNGGVTGKNLEEVLANFPLPDMYDMIAHLKEVAETKPEELRLLLISHPQIAEAIVHMQVKIGMIRPLTRASDQQPYQQQQQQQQQLPQPLQLQPPVHLGAFGQQQKQQQQQQQPHVGGLAAAGGFYQAQPPPLFPSQQVGGWSGQMPPLPPPVPFDPSAGAGAGAGGGGGRGGVRSVGRYACRREPGLGARDFAAGDEHDTGAIGGHGARTEAADDGIAAGGFDADAAGRRDEVEGKEGGREGEREGRRRDAGRRVRSRDRKAQRELKKREKT